MSKRKLLFSAVTLGLVFLLAASITHTSLAFAADSDLDPSFGNGGVATAVFPGPTEGIGYTTGVQPDGKVVIVGSQGDNGTMFAVSRLNADGSPDTSFGLNGSVLTTMPQTPAQSGSMAIQPDGKILAAGYYDSGPKQYAIARYLPDGSLDMSFGNGGKAVAQAGTDESYEGSLINYMVLLPDGKILVAGSTGVNSGSLWIARFNTNGSLDTTFGGDGTSWLSCYLVVGDYNCEGFALVVQPDGKAIVGGTSRASQGGRKFALGRFNTNGSIDTSFGTGGLVTTQMSDSAADVYALGITQDGKILAVGYTCCAPSYGLAMARYNPNGSLDTTFGTGGKTVITGVGAGYSLLMRPGGKILVPGYVVTSTTGRPATQPEQARFKLSPGGNDPGSESGKQVAHPGAPSAPSSDAQFALMQFNADGTFDSSFGTGGKAALDFGGTFNKANWVAQSPDGKLVAAGYVRGDEGDSPRNKFAAARFDSGGSPDPAFGSGGKVIVSPLFTRSEYKKLATQGDNKVVALGEALRTYESNTASYTTSYVVSRYNSNGTPDGSFGSGGHAIFVGQFTDVGIQSTGKVILAHAESSGFVLTRLAQNGSVDTGFGDGGQATITFPTPYGTIDTIVVQADDKIVALGITYDQYYNQSRLALARYNPDGSPDTGFGSGGKVFVESGTGIRVSARAAIVQADGKIVLGGIASSDSGNHMLLMRLNANGTPDDTFGGGGSVIFSEIEGFADIYAVGLQPDGKIVAAGAVQTTSGIDAPVLRVNSNGSPDTTFDGDGVVILDSTGGQEWGNALVVQNDSKPVVSIGSGKLVRLNTNGSLDSSFGIGGVATTPLLPVSDLDMQVDGKIVAAGTFLGPKYKAFAVARFIGGPPPVHAGRFQDVPPDSPFYSYIECMGSLNVISGYPCGGPDERCGVGDKPYFRPNNSMTRGQVAKIVANAAGYSDTPSGQTFEDVPPGSPFYSFIERMSSRHIISGYACGGLGETCVAPYNRPYFRPNANVSRGQLTKIVSNAKGYADTPSGQTFEDVPPTDAFYLFVERLVSREVMSGYPCGGAGEPCYAPDNRGYFRPGRDVTRGQASKIVGNTFFPNCQNP